MKIQNLDYTDAGLMMSALRETVDYIRSRTRKVPEIAMILGSGLGDYLSLIHI